MALSYKDLPELTDDELKELASARDKVITNLRFLATENETFREHISQVLSDLLSVNKLAKSVSELEEDLVDRKSTRLNSSHT